MRTFFRGYQMTATDLATILPQLRALQLIKVFGLVRWAIDRCAKDIPIYSKRARDMLRHREANPFPS